jgi:hypothetical protein
MYSITQMVYGTPESKRIMLGARGHCRFCGANNPVLFRQSAHLIPEALGNKRVFSADECDECNKRFSTYEGELVNAIGPLLTLGGTQGKGGKVRQTGLSTGATRLRHERGGDGSRKIILMASNVEDFRERFTQDREFVHIRTPLPATPFKPMLAHKALAKMALALMDAKQLPHFNGAREALLDHDRPLSRFRASVGLAFGSIGLAPPYVAAYLLRRQDDSLLLPSTLFMLCAGSICVQCFIPSDDLDGFGLDQFAPPLVRFNARFPNTSGGVFNIPYDDPKALDWSSPESQPQPLQEMTLTFNTVTKDGSFAPVWR